MNRRELMLGSAGTLCASMLPLKAASNDETYERFHRNLANRPWLRLYEGVHEPVFPVTACSIEGEIPADMRGALYRNGPGRLERSGRRYQHWFDGDGLVQKWNIDALGNVTHQARLVETRKLLRDEAHGELSLVGFGTQGESPISVNGPDDLNVGNISVLAKDRDIWALWEGGSAWRLDSNSLRTHGRVELSTESAGLPFSAHPRVEPNGTIWNFGAVGYLGALVVWRLAPTSREPELTVVKRSPMTMPHDFVVTEKHLVVPLPPFHYEPDHSIQQTFLDAHVWHNERSLDVLVMDKNDPNDNFVVELPAQWIFHYSNAWEDSSGVIRFEGCRYDDPSLMVDAFKTVMYGESPKALAMSTPAQYQIDTKRRTGRAEDLDVGFDACEFPVVDHRQSTTRHEWVTMLAANGSISSNAALGLLNSVVRMNTTTGLTSHYTYPSDEVAEEHVFVPKAERTNEAEGWLVGTSLNYVDETTHLNVFDVQPGEIQLVARASLPKLMPFGLHGKFVEAI